MSDIVAVLVVPAEGDPGGLLADGVAGSSPPYVGLGPAYEPGRPGGEPEWALPLWWDGALVPEGYDRARRVVAGTLSAPGLVGGDSAVRAWLRDLGESLADAERLAAEVAECGYGSVVRLARVDGRLVEVP